MKTLIRMEKTQNIRDAQKDAKTTIKRQTKKKVVETKSIEGYREPPVCGYPKRSLDDQTGKI